jgi:hypothetical protein
MSNAVYCLKLLFVRLFVCLPHAAVPNKGLYRTPHSPPHTAHNTQNTAHSSSPVRATDDVTLVIDTKQINASSVVTAALCSA